MTPLIIAIAVLLAALLGWPVTALILRVAHVRPEKAAEQSPGQQAMPDAGQAERNAVQTGQTGQIEQTDQTDQTDPDAAPSAEHVENSKHADSKGRHASSSEVCDTGISAAKISTGGASSGGTSAGGASSGGTSTGGTSAGGASTGGIQTAATILRGGLTIGMLERAAVVLCIAFDQPVAIAYVIAIKGLGRYPELKESPAASERFIIGTLASLIWAAVVGVAARWLIGASI